jgi:hypothetical protein
MPNILPDTRAKHPTGVIRGVFGMNWVPVFCANCHKRGPDVPEENCNFAFWLCNNCFEMHGPIAATMIAPDDVFIKEILEERAEKEKQECHSFIQQV